MACLKKLEEPPLKRLALTLLKVRFEDESHEQIYWNWCYVHKKAMDWDCNNMHVGMEWSTPQSFRFDCAICSVIASHDGFSKKRTSQWKMYCITTARWVRTVWMVSWDHTSRSKHKRKMRDVYIQKYHIYKHDMFNHLFVDVSIYLLVYLSIYVYACVKIYIYWCVCLLSSLSVNLSIWH